ncbi:hypothetical protein CH252_33010 [Rhodococcus sp. 06-1477-1B]|nr:hypothetical protein CH252_33010 [Rhodococcus sp. 06-1477-1B]
MCETSFEASRPEAATCSVSCRNKLYRRRLVAQRERLAAQAAAAASSGDVDELTRVARATAALLAA